MIVHPFNTKISRNLTVADLAMEPLIKNGVTQKVVDIGARSGMFELPESFSSTAEFIGFEPNQVEYEKLVNRRTDSMLSGGKQPRFKKQKYFPSAVWSDDSEHELQITIGAGACSLSGKVDRKITEKMYLEGREQYKYYESVQKVVDTAMVSCSRLDSLIPEEEVIDYLKVDVEGGELDVFLGAERLLSKKSILFIKTEFLVTPYYQNKVLFGHQHVFLEKMGYRLIDIDLSHLRYLREPTKIPKTVDRRPIYAGDAYFMLDPDLVEMDPITRHRLAIMLLVFGFNSLAISLIKEAKQLSVSEVCQLEIALAKVPLHKIIKETWRAFPYKIWPFLKKMGLFREG